MRRDLARKSGRFATAATSTGAKSQTGALPECSGRLAKPV